MDYLKSVKKAEAVVFANRYDGIDLPDNDCRILVLDSLPYFETFTSTKALFYFLCLA
jgi:Rad3-related DNA helicase